MSGYDRRDANSRRGIFKSFGRKANSKQLIDRYSKGPCPRTGSPNCNCDLLRQDDPALQNPLDSQGQRFQEAVQQQALWMYKLGVPEMLQRYGGYRSAHPVPNYGWAQKRYLYTIDAIPFGNRTRWRKPPGEKQIRY